MGLQGVWGGRPAPDASALAREASVKQRKTLEARPGIEPGCKDLQSSASPLRHRASMRWRRRNGHVLRLRQQAICDFPLIAAGAMSPRLSKAASVSTLGGESDAG